MSGPISITTERVLIAEAMFIFSNLKIFGGTILTVFFSIQETFTPILSRISITLFTSSIWAMPWRVVTPLFKREAHRSPTDPFLEKFVLILPLNFLPPFTKKSVEMLGCIFVFWVFFFMLLCPGRLARLWRGIESSKGGQALNFESIAVAKGD